MGEANRRLQNGTYPGNGTQKQFTVDLKNATQRECECGCKYFIPVVNVYTVSALVSPTGQKLTVQSPVLVCKNCGEALK